MISKNMVVTNVQLFLHEWLCNLSYTCAPRAFLSKIAGQVAASNKSHMLSSDLRRQEAFYSQFSKVNMFEAMF